MISLSRHTKSGAKNRQAGFTIVELLVATLVFSVMLLVITAGILQITRQYYKGITETNTQNAARAAMETISQAIQFGGGAVVATLSSPTPGNSAVFCIGSQRFSYTLGYELSDAATVNQSFHVLVADVSPACTAQNVRSATGLSAGSHELLGPKMRLAKLSVTPIAGSSNLYKITMRVVYGDDDLLNDPTNPSLPSPASSRTANATCTGRAGSQFCAVSELSTVVVKRVP